jgi:hypothetical protein
MLGNLPPSTFAQKRITLTTLTTNNSAAGSSTQCTQAHPRNQKPNTHFAHLHTKTRTCGTSLTGKP